MKCASRTASMILPSCSSFHTNRNGIARIVEIASHKPGRYDAHVFTVESCPESDEVAMPSVSLHVGSFVSIPAPHFSAAPPSIIIPPFFQQTPTQRRERTVKERLKVSRHKSPPT